jgi:hypothetical protein
MIRIISYSTERMNETGEEEEEERMSDIIMKVNTIFAVICIWCTPTC